MKHIVFLLLLGCPFMSAAQKSSFSRVDRHAATLGYYPLDMLADKLTTPFYTDSEKVRAIFYWITTHISYDVVGYHNDSRIETAELPYDDSEKVEAYFRNKIADKVITTHMAICEGYATLFKLLCDRAKIPSVIIPGYAKITSDDIGKKWEENHAWNAVKLSGNWVLLDACWAAGTCDDGVTKFTAKQNDFFYLTPPWLFIFNHYPTDSKWTLLSDPVSKEQYGNYPQWILSKKSLVKASFAPLNGVLTARVGDTLTIEAELCESDSASMVREMEVDELDAAGNFIDHRQSIPVQQRMLNSIKKKLTYRYIVWSPAVKELAMTYGNEHLIAYKLQVR